MSHPAAMPAVPVPSEAQVPGPKPPAATSLAARRSRRYPLSPASRQSAKALAARRANLIKARAAARQSGYRRTEARRAASRANLQKAIAWRRSPQGNAVARRNAFRHGLAVKKLPELLVPLGEGPEDLERHREMVWLVFLPQDELEADLAERVAQASWRRLRVLRARAREELLMWRRLQARAGQQARLSQEETERRRAVIWRRLDLSSTMEDEAFGLETRIVKLLDALVAKRSAEEDA